MTELPKDLITPSKSSSIHHREEHRHAPRPSPRFKELMQSRRENTTATEDTDVDENAEAPALPSLASILSSMHTKSSIAPVTQMSAEVTALYEKMASTMLVMTSAQTQETTLFLDGPNYASSVFAGSRITIKEFTTAPKTFNIEIATHSTALNLLAAHKAAIMSAFESGKFPFSVHRFETELHSKEERVVFSTREFESQDDQDHKEDHT